MRFESAVKDLDGNMIEIAFIDRMVNNRVWFLSLNCE